MMPKLFIKTLLLVAFATVFTTTQTKAEVVDSAKIYLAKNWPALKKITRTYVYVQGIADAEPDYALKYGKKLLRLSQQIDDSLSLARSYYLIGYAYASKENYVLSFDYLFKALQLGEPLGDFTIVTNSYNVIGICYSKQNQHKKAAEYFKKVVEKAEAAKSDHQTGVSYNNLAIEYQHLKQYSLSDHYLKKSYAIFEKTKVNKYLSHIFMNRGVIRFDKGMYDSALVFYRKAAELHYLYNEDPLPSSISNNIGEVFYKLKQYDSSLFYLNLSLQSVDTLSDKYSTRELYKHLSNTYFANNNVSKAYYYLRKHNQVNDYIFNDENLKRSVASEANYHYIQKENELRLSEEKRAFDAKRNNLFLIFGSITGLLLLIALIIAIFRFREKKKANAILVEQKKQIEEQAKEITDSINYAKRIQDSILPTSDIMQKILGEHLLIYMPRDIVGGDFYYVEEIDGKKYFSVIDCTGHGVPGGFMSILGYNGLQNAILDLKFRHPNEILDNLSRNLVTHFTQEGKQTLRDGMDMALCCLYEQNGKTMLEFSGAHNPCWLVKHKTNELLEIDASKQPIGYFEDYKPFTNHVMEVEKGDMVYLFSDGYADQFGGLKGKKFKYSQMKSLILHTPKLSIKEKEEALRISFIDWKGNYEQLDDVCVLGIRV
jgi:serine phosphatase RsbU (regulator of sigma subunit)